MSNGASLRAWVARAAVAVLLLTFALYCGDYLSLRYEIPKGRPMFGSVRVDHFQAVPLKNGKNEYDPIGSEQVTCTRSLFPQLGDAPCWWLKRHREQVENL